MKYFITVVLLIFLIGVLFIIPLPGHHSLYIAPPQENLPAPTPVPPTQPLKAPTSTTPTSPIPHTTQQPIKPAPTNPPAPLKTPLPQSNIYGHGLHAVVNMLCDQDANHYTVATGVIVSGTGYIISNAHVAENLPKSGICTIRHGSPARQFGTAHLVLFPHAYIAAQSNEEKALYDIALWKLDSPTTTLPFFTIDLSSIAHANDIFLTLSYPAELLSSQIILKDLNLLFSNTTVTKTDGHVIESRSTLSAQHGSSGGVLVDPYTAELRGIIFGINENTDVSSRLLYSIAPQSINRIVLEETGKTITDFLGGSR